MEYGMHLKTEKKMTKSKSKFRGRVSRDAHRQKQSASNYGYLQLPSGVSMFKEEPGGRIRLDIMPYIVTEERHPDRDDENQIAIPGDVWYKRPFKVHRGIGSGNDSYVCPTSIGKRCPICDYRSKRMKEGAEREETDALKPSLRNLYVVIPVKSKEHEEEPHIWDISQAMFQKLLNEELEERPDYEIFPDLEEGLTLYIRFDSRTIGKGGRPFAEANRIDFEDRKEMYDESIMDEIPDLDKVLKIYSFKELEMKFLEIDDEEPGEPVTDDEEEEVVRKPLRKPKTIEKDGDYDLDDDDEQENTRKRHKNPDYEEEKPKKKIIRKKPESEPEEDQEEEPTKKIKKPIRKQEPEEEEEQEEEKPKRNIRKPVLTTKGKDNGERCPHGHRFGIDTEKFDECDDCTLWDACMEEEESKE